MRVHVLQHTAPEGLGSIEAWLLARQAAISTTRFFAGDALPPAQGFDLVIALGGPMSVNDEAALPWLVAEKAFLREVMAAGTAVLGICLGAQLIASALGARVYPNAQKEIGWFPVQGLPGAGDSFAFPAEAQVFHWHGETFDLPAGARLLASSEACVNQAFQLGRHILGLQFHLETDPALAQAFVAADHAEPADQRELVAGKPYVQTAEQILAAPASYYAGINQLMAAVLAYLLR